MAMLRRKKLIFVIGISLILIGLLAAGFICWLRSTIFPAAYRSLVEEAAAKHELDPFLVAAVIFTESGFDPEAVSPKNAVGLMQLMPDTAGDMARQLKITDFKPARLTEPELNLDLGCCYLKKMLKKHNGDLTLALAAYHAGPENVKNWLKKAHTYNIISNRQIIADFAFKSTACYVEKVFNVRKLLKLLY